MKVGLFSNPVNFKGASEPVRLDAKEKEEIKRKAKTFEDKLSQLGKDSFIKQHENVRKEQFDIFCRAQFCMSGNDRDFTFDPKFLIPERRFNYLLKKAQKYQTSEAIDNFTDVQTEKFNATVEDLKKNIQNYKKQLKTAEETLQTLLTNRVSEIKSGTISWMDKKINDLEKLFKESQEISPRHQEVKEDLEEGRLP